MKKKSYFKKTAVKISALVLALVIAMPLFIACSKEPEEPKYNDNYKPNDSNNSESETVVKKHNVIFDYNDGSGRTESIKIPDGKTLDLYAPYPVDGSREVIAWSADLDGAEYSAPVKSDITVYAQWQTISITTYTSDIPEIITDKFVEINVSSNNSSLAGKRLRIGAGVKSITLKSNGAPIYDLSIVISERSSDLNMTMESFSFKSTQSFGIKSYASDAYAVKLKLVGESLIDCTEYQPFLGESGSSCINVGKLELYGTGNLTLLGGNGQNGESMPDAGNGENGKSGTSGASGTCGIISNSLSVRNITLTIVAGNGGNGGNGGAGNVANYDQGGEGGDGGNGGLGGDAIRAKIFRSESAVLTLTSGNGGNGGKGGKGGGGGISFFNTYKDGGNGGRGGNGGFVFASMIQSFDSGDSICNYSAGTGGSGGNRGGGGAGYEGSNGAEGANGKINAK